MPISLGSLGLYHPKKYVIKLLLCSACSVPLQVKTSSSVHPGFKQVRTNTVDRTHIVVNPVLFSKDVKI